MQKWAIVAAASERQDLLDTKISAAPSQASRTLLTPIGKCAGVASSVSAEPSCPPIPACPSTQLHEAIHVVPLHQAISTSTLDLERISPTTDPASPRLARNWSPDTPKPTDKTMTKTAFRKALNLEETDMELLMEFARYTCQNCGTFSPSCFNRAKPNIRTLEKVHPGLLERTLNEVSQAS